MKKFLSIFLVFVCFLSISTRVKATDFTGAAALRLTGTNALNCATLSCMDITTGWSYFTFDDWRYAGIFHSNGVYLGEQRLFFDFDTSSIPAGSTINSATLTGHWYCSRLVDWSDPQGGVVLVNAAPIATASANYNWAMVNNPTYASNSLDCGTNADTNQVISLNAAGLAHINPGGHTAYAAVILPDANNSESGATWNNGYNLLHGMGVNGSQTYTLAINYTVAPMPKITTTPATASVAVGAPFNVDITVNGDGTAFNAAQATVTVSSNLTVSGLYTPSSNGCNFQYTQSPNTANPSFAGAIYASSSANCKAYTMTLTPTATGSGTVTITNGSIKAYSNGGEILYGVQNGTYTIGAGTPAPSPTPATGFTISSYFPETYSAVTTMSGTRDASITQIFVNGSSTGVTYPTNNTWQVTLSLAMGANSFELYGRDDNQNQTSSQMVNISRHSLADINGDNVVNLIDASLFGVDWGKTSNLTYHLSDMDGNGAANLADLSILAKLITP